VRHGPEQKRVEEPAISTVASSSGNAHNDRESSAATEIVVTLTLSHSRGRRIPPHGPRRSARIAARVAGEYAGI